LNMGLPVGFWQVDLIICFNSGASPIRSIQRMGRTGRHKEGRVVHILSEGYEEGQYRKGLQARPSAPAISTLFLSSSIYVNKFTCQQHPDVNYILPRLFCFHSDCQRCFECWQHPIPWEPGWH
jgi:hypothetical protein